MKKTIFIDCTHTYHTNVNSGIQRVVRNIIRNATKSAQPYQLEIQPVIYQNEKFYPAELEKILFVNEHFEEQKKAKKSLRQQFVSLYHIGQNALAFVIPFKPVKKFLTAPKEYFGLSWLLATPLRMIQRKNLQQSIVVDNSINSMSTQDGNILLLLDFAADINIWPSVQNFRQKGGKAVTVVYDLIPLNYPETTADYLYGPFKKWLNNSIDHSDKIIAISKFVADEVKEYIALETKKSIPVDYFLLGSELDLEKDSGPSPEFEAKFKRHNTYISIGSIEPRKNHKYILDAFDILWSKGYDASIILIGKQGWKNEDLITRIHNHPEYNKRLHLVRNATDTDLAFAYKTAKALIFASIVEGFGLPIVEAFQKKLIVLCSDIPVFREIADHKALFFNLEKPETLAEQIIHFNECVKSISPDSKWINWAQSADQLIQRTIC